MISESVLFLRQCIALFAVAEGWLLLVTTQKCSCFGFGSMVDLLYAVSFVFPSYTATFAKGEFGVSSYAFWNWTVFLSMIET